MPKVQFIKSLYPYTKGEIVELKQKAYDMRKDKWYFVDFVENKKQDVKENKSMQKRKKKNKSL